ncbi:LysR family transcriptional regulator [Frigidibacter sp. ROC022]|uniref:LysR family transcriptional regulator n=1 Tax=Frigidibacter sp. ROC022 TaxID=2971796 RepID=UPI00215AEF7E|nr:LysR family transcriptional regulator [Frigidibacter sp. ROC022]MCR8723766.1 LysR family transcriptional regulator [Frigidibacter sp. ROC022]
MSPPKRFLPPISALRALEAFARTGNVTVSGRELGLSQSAVSRQLRVLEEYLDTDLFIRNRKRITLTAAAQSYANEVRRGLEQIANASLRLKANPTGGLLNLAILPAFGMRWLAPKLPDFVRRHPQVTVNLGTRLTPFDFREEAFHAAIHFGQPDWPEVHHLKLMREEVIAVAAPEMAAGFIPGDPASIFALPLLHLDSRPDAWENWARQLGFEVAPPRGMLVDQFASIVQAAVHGMGVALAPTFLIDQEIADGRLVAAPGVAPISIGDYYLVWPKTDAPFAPCRMFEQWLRTQI